MNVGDTVKATCDIWQEADDHSPLMLLANQGDLLEVRKVNGEFWPLHVGHPSREPDAMFGVTLGEVQPLKPDGHVTDADLKEAGVRK
jgi:hypothetical protein